LAGIYIHIPFCKTKCIYCDFCSKTDLTPVSDYVNAVCLELDRRRDYLHDELIETIYFGGGTPGLLACKDLNLIISRIYDTYSVASDLEITLEANPEDLTSEYIAELRELPINRISMGIQSFNDNELRFLNRRHNSLRVLTAVNDCMRAGFDNISIDLMYGLPGQTLHSWKNTLMQAIRIGVPHISAYHLIYEEGTPIYRMSEKGLVVPVEEDVSVDMFEMLIDTLTEAGFEHYEISNFAKPGYISRHNSSYWENKEYLGVGVSAHSYNRTGRDYNISDTEEYIKCIFNGDSVTTTEPTDKNTAYNDFVITSLRTARGLSLSELKSEFGAKYEQYCIEQSKQYISDGFLCRDGDRLKLTRKGIFISDSIMSDLLQVDE
jgi:oxygen-independent coproporphyrinogen-3 oxidase